MENSKVPQAALDRIVGFIQYCGGELLELGRFMHVSKPLLFQIGKLGVRIMKKL